MIFFLKVLFAPTPPEMITLFKPSCFNAWIVFFTKTSVIESSNAYAMSALISFVNFFCFLTRYKTAVLRPLKLKSRPFECKSGLGNSKCFNPFSANFDRAAPPG